MTDDLVKRLRWRAESNANCLCGNPVCDEAADRIEQDAQHIDEMYALVAAMNADHTASKTRIEKLETKLKEVSMWKLREQLGGDKSRYGLPTNEQYYDHIILDLREEAAYGESTCSKLAENAADYIEGMQYQLRCDHSWKSRAEKLEAALQAVIRYAGNAGDDYLADKARKALEGKDD